MQCEYVTNIEESHAKAIQRKYNEAQQGLNAHQELFSALQSMSESDALGIMTRIRQGKTAEELMSQIREGNLLLQLSLTPESRLKRYDFPFVNSMPSFLVSSKSPIVQSKLYTATLGQSSPMTFADPNTTNEGGNIEDTYLKPYHAAKVADSRLSKVKARLWTGVVADDLLVQKLLDAYFLHAYFDVAIFHKDYFLDDLAAGRHELCSPLLVNVILAWGTVSGLHG